MYMVGSTPGAAGMGLGTIRDNGGGPWSRSRVLGCRSVKMKGVPESCGAGIYRNFEEIDSGFGLYAISMLAPRGTKRKPRPFHCQTHRTRKRENHNLRTAKSMWYSRQASFVTALCRFSRGGGRSPGSYHLSLISHRTDMQHSRTAALALPCERRAAKRSSGKITRSEAAVPYTMMPSQ